MEKLHQNRFYIKKSYLIKEAGIEYYSRDYEGEFTKFVSYKDIKARSLCRLYTESYPKIIQAATVLFVAGCIRLIFSNDAYLFNSLVISFSIIFLSALTFYAYFATKTRYYLIELEDDTQLFVLYNSPSVEEMNRIIDTIYAARKNNYRANYFYINYKNSKSDELNKMEWLRSEDLITPSEYEVVVEEIEDKLVD